MSNMNRIEDHTSAGSSREFKLHEGVDGSSDDSKHVPLCVDLDGTVVKTDIFFESLVRLLTRNPIFIFYAIVWYFRGKTIFKMEVFKRVRVDVRHLPYHDQLLNYLRGEARKGRPLILISGTLRPIAKKVAKHLQIFSEVHASDLKTNLTAEKKAQFLVNKYGAGQYDYIGNSMDDIPVWKHARRSMAVNSGALTLKLARQRCGAVFAMDTKPALAKLVVKALRVHQWVKNFLIFIPIFLANKMEFEPLVHSTLAFISFSLMASAGYIINDLMDMDSDRQHPYKSRRAFASGELSIKAGLLTIPVLLLVSLAISSQLSPGYTAIVIGYFAMTMTYSIALKKIELVDVFVLASLYTLRLYAGGFATNTEISSWLLAFTTFFFLSLALIKRCSELASKMIDESSKDAKVRGYYGIDYRQLQSLGTAAGYISVLILALYINSDTTKVHYYQPNALWGVLFLLTYWISRMWLISNRGKMHYDPIVFAVKDKVTHVILIFMAVFMLIARGI